MTPSSLKSSENTAPFDSAVLVLLIISGCSDFNSERITVNGDTSNFIKAEMRSLLPNRNTNGRLITGDELQKLVRFFPSVGTSRSSSVAGGWIAGTEIVLYRENLSAVRILIDLQC